MKRNWIKPELIVLRKGKTQEAVLTVCKAVTVSGRPETGTSGQTCGNPNVGSCSACSARPPKS
jgi:hypothetical protein